jgi:hypothetical protein
MMALVPTLRRVMIETVRNDPEDAGGNYTTQPRMMEYAVTAFGFATLAPPIPHRIKSCAAVQAHFLSVHRPPRLCLIAQESSIRWLRSHNVDPRAQRIRRRCEDPMRKNALIVMMVFWGALTSVAQAIDRGQFDDVPDNIRSWFKAQISPSGVPCCDIADGHRTEYDVRGGAYWVPIDGLWWQVPDRAVIRDGGNPVGEAVVWYVHHRGGIVISCFVPADAV